MDLVSSPTVKAKYLNRPLVVGSSIGHKSPLNFIRLVQQIN